MHNSGSCFAGVAGGMDNCVQDYTRPAQREMTRAGINLQPYGPMRRSNAARAGFMPARPMHPSRTQSGIREKYRRSRFLCRRYAAYPGPSRVAGDSERLSEPGICRAEPGEGEKSEDRGSGAKIIRYGTRHNVARSLIPEVCAPRFSTPAKTGIRLRRRERDPMECRPCNFSSESPASEGYNIILWYRHNTGTPEDFENREPTEVHARRRHEVTVQRHVDRSGTFCGHAVHNSLRTSAARWEQGSRLRASREDESL